MPSLARSVLTRSALLLLAATPVAAQVCEGPITLSSQAEVDAFDCTEVTSDLTVRGFDIWNLDGLAGLTAVGGYLIIRNNDALASLAGLGGLTSVGGGLTIGYNDALTDLTGLGGLTSLGGHLFIDYNEALTDLTGLGGVTSVGGPLFIEYNDTLTDLSGLGGIASVGGALIISTNAALTDLTGLGGITSVEALVIAFNDALTNLDALASVASVESDLIIEYNGVLGKCTVGLYDLLTSGGVGGDVVVHDNAPGCNSVEEILEGGPVSAEVEAAALVTGLAPAYPNPTSGTTTLAYTLAEPANVRLAVYDVLGRRVRTLVEGPGAVGTHEARMAGLAAGAYVVRFEANGEAWTQRVTVAR